MYNDTSVSSEMRAHYDPHNIIYEQYALAVAHGKAKYMVLVMAEGKEIHKESFNTLSMAQVTG